MTASPTSDFYKLQQGFETFSYEEFYIEETEHQSRILNIAQQQLSSSSEESSEQENTWNDIQNPTLYIPMMEAADYTAVSSEVTEKAPLKTKEKTQSTFESCLESFLSFCCCKP